MDIGWHHDLAAGSLPDRDLEHAPLIEFEGQRHEFPDGSDTIEKANIPGWAQLAVRHFKGDLAGGGLIKRFKLLLEILPSNRQSSDEIVHMAWFNPDVAASEEPERARLQYRPSPADRGRQCVEGPGGGELEMTALVASGLTEQQRELVRCIVIEGRPPEEAATLAGYHHKSVYRTLRLPAVAAAITETMQLDLAAVGAPLAYAWRSPC